MNKKSIISTLIVLALSVSTVCAFEVDKTDTSIKIFGNKSSGENVRLNVTTDSDDFIWIDSVNADEAGAYSLSFTVPFKDETVTYKCLINGSEDALLTVEGTEDIIKILKNCSESEFSRLLSVYAKRFGYDITLLDDVTNKATAYSIFKSCEVNTAKDILLAYNIACAICVINEGDRGDALEIMNQYYEYIAPTFKNDTKLFSSKELEKFAIELVKKDYESKTSFDSGYKAAIKAATEKESPSKPTGGGGGGGSSSTKGGRGDFVPAPDNTTTDKPENTNDITDDVFNDISDVLWARDSIIKLNKLGVIKGVGDGRFAPNNDVTREEFVAMLVRRFSLEGSDNKSFEDVPNGVWYKSVVSVAYENGIANGISEDLFGSGRSITRGECAAMCKRVLTKFGVEIQMDEDKFTDDDDIPEYAKEGVYSLKKLGIISGMGNNMFCPNETCTRAMTAKIIDLLGECCK